MPKPNLPFKWKPWHFVAIGVGVFLIYKGYQKVSEEYWPKIKIKENKK